MSEELVRRLHADAEYYDRIGMYKDARNSREAADAIERLTKERDAHKADAYRMLFLEEAQTQRAEAAEARVAKLEEALGVCDRVLHFDLRRMIEWGADYNQAVKDAADCARAALSGGEK